MSKFLEMALAAYATVTLIGTELAEMFQYVADELVAIVLP